MAIAPTGTKQKTYYVREDLARIVAMIASRDDRRESDVVNEAFELFITHKLTTAELKVFGYKKEKQNGDNGRNGAATGEALQGVRGRGGDESGTSGFPPGTKKRAGKKAEARRG